MNSLINKWIIIELLFESIDKYIDFWRHLLMKIDLIIELIIDFDVMIEGLVALVSSYMKQIWICSVI